MRFGWCFGKYSASQKFILVTAKRLVKTQGSEKRITFQWKKYIGLSFLVISSMTKLRQQLMRSTRCSDKYCANEKIISLGLKKATNKFFKKRLFTIKRYWPAFFSSYRVRRTTGNTLLVSTMYSDKECGINKRISVLPKGWRKHKFLKKKAIFTAKKNYGPSFSLTIGYGKPQGTFYKGSQNFCVYIASCKIISLGPKRSIETAPQKKRLTSQGENNLDYFASCYRARQTSGNISLGCKKSFGKLCGSYKIISITAVNLLKTNFGKIGFFSSEKNNLDFFLFIEHYKRRVAIYNGPEGNLKLSVQDIRSIL